MCLFVKEKKDVLWFVRALGTEVGIAKDIRPPEYANWGTHSIQASGVSEGVSEGAVVSIQSSGLTGTIYINVHCHYNPATWSPKGVQNFGNLRVVPGSTASFCNKRLMNGLHLTGKKDGDPSQNDGVRESFFMSNLEVSGMESNNFWNLPAIFTRRKMPVHQEKIPRTMDLEHWPHLKHVRIPEVEEDANLLIGTNIIHGRPGRLLVKWTVGPDDIKIILGWVVIGLLKVDFQMENQCL